MPSGAAFRLALIVPPDEDVPGFFSAATRFGLRNEIEDGGHSFRMLRHDAPLEGWLG